MNHQYDIIRHIKTFLEDEDPYKGNCKINCFSCEFFGTFNTCMDCNDDCWISQFEKPPPKKIMTTSDTYACYVIQQLEKKKKILLQKPTDYNDLIYEISDIDFEIDLYKN